MKRQDHPLYIEDLELVSVSGIDWSLLDGATIGVSGATGMIGTVLIDALVHAIRTKGLSIHIVALGRDKEKAQQRLPYFYEPFFTFEEYDVSVPGMQPTTTADIVIHLASTTHPRAYATQPISTIASNVTGLQNLLEWQLASNPGGRFCFASSVEVYGENRGDVERFDEKYCGYINCNTLRAGYPEAKRLGEALCQAYASERGSKVFLPRLTRVYGPTLLSSDTKALSQFLHKAVNGEDVVLKSEGAQQYSYLYAADAVCGLLWVLTRGQSGVAYNVADERSDVSLRELASFIAQIGGGKVVFELPDEVERAGYSTATKAMLDGSLLQSIGWEAVYGIEDGLKRTIHMMKDLG